MSKKISLISLVVILMLAIIIPSSKVYAAETPKEILTVNAIYDIYKIVVDGTTEEGMLAVSVQVCDEDGNFLFLRTGEVDSSNKYKLEIEVEPGTYILKVADFNGGIPKVVTVSEKIIDEINLSLTPPTIGDKVASTKISEDEYTQDNEPKVTAENGANYTISVARWISGTYEDLGSEYGTLISTTFEKDKDYYAGMLVEANPGYRFADNVTVKINGEEPAEVHDVFGSGKYELIISKIKATEKAEETTDTETNKAVTPKTGDNIMIFASIFVVAIVAYVIVLKNRKNKKIVAKHDK